MGEIIQSPEQDFLPIEQVFALRALALGVIGKQARRWLDRPKTSGFALYEATGDDMGSDTLERYLGVIAKKIDYDYWQMTISVRETRLSEQTSNSNVLIQNRFNWNKQGRCLGTRIMRSTHAFSEETTGEGVVSPSVVREHLSWAILTEDIVDISEELIEVSQSVDTNHLRRFALNMTGLEKGS
jgi:hypothetical protein